MPIYSRILDKKWGGDIIKLQIKEEVIPMACGIKVHRKDIE